MVLNFKFSEQHFNRIFPFYILVSQEMVVESTGSTLEKMYSGVTGKNFNDAFCFKRPHAGLQDFEGLKSMTGQLLLIECNNTWRTNLRGQLDYLPDVNKVIFMGSAWFNSIDELLENKLSLHDFAFHDSMVDLLHVMMTQENANTDLKFLLEKVSSQKDELKRANQEIHDIALFPKQNPDPLIRINLQGELLQNNPVAAQLDFLTYENKVYSNHEFFKIIAKKIDTSDKRWFIEAGFQSKIYSFVCVSMVEDGYINIYGRDITQQKYDQEQLERLSLVASANHNGVLFTDRHGKIFWCNEGLEKITGYCREEIIGRTPIELLRGTFTDSAGLKKMVDDFYNLRSFNNELIQYRKDGSCYWAKTKGQPVKSKDGNLSYFAIIEDISLEKEKEEQLRVLSSIAEENTHGVIIADRDGSVQWANKSFEKMSGYSLQELMGQKPGDILHGPETDKATASYISNQIKKGEPFVCEILNYHKNGTDYWIRLQGQALKDKDGNVTKLFAIEEDITEEKKLAKKIKDIESKFKLALDKIGDNVWEYDLRTRKIQFLQQRKSFSGFEITSDRSLEMIWADIIYKPDLPIIEEARRRYVDGESDSQTLEYRVVDANGDIRWVMDRGVVLEKNADNKPVLVIGAHTDITNLKNIEEQLLIAKDAAEASRKTKEIFLANMSHEIRTPMNAIIGMATQLKKAKLDAQQQLQLDTINTAAQNLLVIINDILDLSKLEAGKLALEKIGFKPGLVIERSMQVMEHKAEEKGLAFTNSFIDPQLSQVLVGDPYRLNQVILNLLSNAIKFTEKGNIDISCRVIKQTPANQQIEIIVQDTGIGMAPEYVNNLFQKFSQEDNSVARKFGGTGLGMSIIREIVDLMGGNIRVDSRKGEGTLVSITLTFKKGNEKDLPGKNTELYNTEMLQGKKVLIVDDNEMNRLVAATILKSYNVAVAEADSGPNAIELMRNQTFDMVLMDIQMPGMNGYEAASIIRKEISKEIPLVALTANAISGEQQKCLDAGMDDYISKPFDEGDFISLICKRLAGGDVNHLTPLSLPELSTPPLFDLGKLKEIAKGNEDFVVKMIRLFIKEAPAAITSVKQAMQGGDLGKVKDLLHRIKPSISSMGIVSIKNDLLLAETTTAELHGAGKLDEKIARIEQVIKEVVKELKKIDNVV